MRRLCMAIAVVALGAWLGTRAVQADGIREPTALDRLLEAYYGPLSDPLQGRLYEAVVELLSAARELPESLDLGEVAAPEPAETAAEGGPESEEQRSAKPVRAQAAEGAKWLAVLDHPVVGDEELAHAYFAAGLFQEAASLYRRLREQAPDDEHVLVMLSLCERNAGNTAEALNLLAEVRKKGTEAARWADWTVEMMSLGEGKTEGAK